MTNCEEQLYDHSLGHLVGIGVPICRLKEKKGLAHMACSFQGLAGATCFILLRENGSITATEAQNMLREQKEFRRKLSVGED